MAASASHVQDAHPLDATNALLERFEFSKLLNTDSGGRRIMLQGSIDGAPALLLAERGAFATDPAYLQSFSRLLSRVQNLGDNDIYHWYLAHSSSSSTAASEKTSVSHALTSPPPDLKLNLIYPSTDKHLRKYAFQQARAVRETPEVYARFVRPYMQRCREEGRLNWIFNILDGTAEQENVLYRSPSSSAAGERHRPGKEDDEEDEDGFVLLPDLNWDRQTATTLHLLALVTRRDIWSVRDLRRRHVGWLRRLRATLVDVVVQQQHLLSSGGGTLEPDLLKFYLHYQPTYYHFHVHIVHVDLDATATQAVGKALALDQVIAQLESMSADTGAAGAGEEPGMHRVELTYTLGENSELWQQVFLLLKEGRQPLVSDA